MPTQVDEEPYALCYDCETELWDYNDTYSLDGYMYCESCYETRRFENEDESSSEFIQSHETKPTPKFCHDSGSITLQQAFVNGFPQIYFGLEIEAEATGDMSPHDGAERILDECGDFTYIKEDGSLTYGMEIVTHPMSYGFVHNHANKLWDGLNTLRRNGFKSWQTSTCGLHIHISRNAFLNDRHKQKFFYFIYGSANKNERDAKHIANIKEFAGRDVQWSKFAREYFIGEHYMEHDENGNPVYGFPTLGDIAKGYFINKRGERVATSRQSGDRYLAINRNNRTTFELRFFRPSLRPATVISCVEFTQCLFDYCEAVPTQDILRRNALSSFQMLGEFAMTNRDKYSNFIARAIKRGVVKDPSEGEHEDDDDNNC